jgi:hypothetical protein
MVTVHLADYDDSAFNYHIPDAILHCHHWTDTSDLPTS